MTRALQIAHLVLLAAAAGLCVAGGLFLWHLDSAVASTSLEVNQTLQQVQTATGRLSDTLDAINRPCGSGKPCGTLADVAKTLNTARLTLGQVEVAANHEDKRIAVLDAQEAQLASDTHALLTKAGGAADAIPVTLAHIDTTLDALKPGEANAATSFADLDAFIKGPQVTGIATNVQAMTANGNRILKDGADEADKLVHPPMKKLTFWGALDAAALWIHSHLIPPIF